MFSFDTGESGRSEPAGLLDTYFTERYPIGAQVLDWSRAQVAIMRPEPKARAVHAIVRDLMNTKDGATYFAGRVWGIAAHYDLDGDNSLVGYSVPNSQFEDGTTIAASMRDGKGVLLDFGANDSLRALASKYQDDLKYLTVNAKDQLGLTAVLVRPDGVVAWGANGEVEVQSLENAIALWFARPA